MTFEDRFQSVGGSGVLTSSAQRCWRELPGGRRRLCTSARPFNREAGDSGVSPRSGRTTAEVYQSWHLELGRDLLKPCGGGREDVAKPAAAAQRLEPGGPSVGRAP